MSATDETVTFRRRGDQTASLPPLVFLRRFLQHVLPFGFVKIRHYGLLASGNVTTRLERARALLGGGVAERDGQIKQQDSESDESWPELLAAVAVVDVTLCPSCGAHALQRGPLPSPRPSANARFVGLALPRSIRAGRYSFHYERFGAERGPFRSRWLGDGKKTASLTPVVVAFPN